MPYFEVINMHPDYQNSATRLLKTYLEAGNKMELILPEKDTTYYRESKDQAIAKATQAKNQGIDANSTLSSLVTAAKKHQQVVREMEQKVKGDTKITLRLLEERAHDFEQRASIILSQ